MKVQQGITENLCNVLSTIFKRTYAFSIRKLLLTPQIQTDQAGSIAHYDNYCEGAELIIHTLKTCLQRKKMQAFINIKSHSNRRFRRTNSLRPKSSVQRRRPESKQSSTNSSYLYQKQNRSFRTFTPCKKNEVNEIFSRVKIIASNLVEPKSQRKSFGSHNQNNSQINRAQIFNKIQQLEQNLKSLIESKGKFNSTNEHNTSSYRKNRERQISRNIQVSNFDVYI